MGVRRVGKSVLCQSLPGCEYFDCELPRVRRLLEDPETFLRQHGGKRVVLDEARRLPNPSELLKIAADHFPTARILATGSSTLGASARFRDTLTGRKAEVWLTPMTLADLVDFGNEDRIWARGTSTTGAASTATRSTSSWRAGGRRRPPSSASGGPSISMPRACARFAAPTRVASTMSSRRTSTDPSRGDTATDADGSARVNWNTPARRSPVAPSTMTPLGQAN
jgi:hypothetical protein